MEPEAKAPRLEAYWRRAQCRSVISMRRSTWDAFDASSSNVAIIEISRTPLGSVAEQSSVVAAVAQRFSPSDGRISIYRHDEKDQPTPINVDHYQVYLDLGRNPRLGEMIAAASTSYDENMQAYLQQHVHLVKDEPGPDHWLSELPGSVQAVVDRMRSIK